MTSRQLKYIYWFANYNLDSPSVRYRAKYPLDFAKEKLGIASRLVIPGYSPGRILNFILAYFSALFFPKKDSIIVIQRVQTNFIYANLLKLLVKLRKSRSVYDLDDADYLEYEPNNIYFFARNCKYISAGSLEIANFLRKYNQNVYHITSPTSDLEIVKGDKNKIFTIGWVGGYSWGHRDSLYNYIFPAVKDLSFDCKLILIGVTKSKDEAEIKAYFKGYNQVKLDLPKEIDWNNEKALQERIVQFDIGVATLLNTPFQLSKSGIKAKQYMNNGVPVLCNNLPENNNFVLHGHNGFLCDSKEEFKARMIQFKEMNSEEYLEFSSNARSSISNYNHFNYFEKLKTIIQQ